jgi:DNA-binding response OmpR family regulator
LGKGARFVVRLPPLAPTVAPRILVVDDDPVTLKTVCIFLRDAGYAVEGVETGRAAQARLATQPPDAVVLDIGLPDMSGWDLLGEIRSTNETQEIPVLVMTGREDGADTAKEMGANEFLTKPISASVLTQVVRDLLATTPRAGLS